MNAVLPDRDRPGALVVASHERSGTHLLIDTLRRNFRACRARPMPGRNPHRWLYFSLDRLAPDHPRPATTREADAALARATRPLVKTHMLPGFDRLNPGGLAWVKWALAGAHTLYVYRDGRAVMPSYHFHAISENPDTPRDFSEFLRTPVRGVTPPERWARHVNAWLAHTRCHDHAAAVRFEDLLADPEGEIRRLGALINEAPLPATPSLPPRGQSAWSARLARFTGRLDSSNLAERGEHPPAWTELFTPDDRARFHELAGQTLIELGYIADDAWVSQHDA